MVQNDADIRCIAEIGQFGLFAAIGCGAALDHMSAKSVTGTAHSRPWPCLVFCVTAPRNRHYAITPSVNRADLSGLGVSHTFSACFSGLWRDPCVVYIHCKTT